MISTLRSKCQSLKYENTLNTQVPAIGLKSILSFQTLTPKRNHSGNVTKFTSTFLTTYINLGRVILYKIFHFGKAKYTNVVLIHSPILIYIYLLLHTIYSKSNDIDNLRTAAKKK